MLRNFPLSPFRTVWPSSCRRVDPQTRFGKSDSTPFSRDVRVIPGICISSSSRFHSTVHLLQVCCVAYCVGRSSLRAAIEIEFVPAITTQHNNVTTQDCSSSNTYLQFVCSSSNTYLRFVVLAKCTVYSEVALFVSQKRGLFPCGRVLSASSMAP